MNVLVIGCGNIGALYDFQTEEIKTHCKALSMLPSVTVSVYDEDITLSKKVAEKYGFTCIPQKTDICLSEFQWVVIASPTDTHLYWLMESFRANVPLIICEKPVAKTADELMELEKLYNSHKTKIVVNYFRRFLPAYSQLKENIISLGANPTHVVVKYQRGLMNNFSHAADLMSFIFGAHSFENINVSQSVFDEFNDDPTLSFTCAYNKIPVSVIGLAHARYSYFEIEMFFKDKKIHISDNGNKITYHSAVPTDRYYQPLQREQIENEDSLLTENMKYVYQHVVEVFEDRQHDNFISSVKMNRNILQIIQNL